MPSNAYLVMRYQAGHRRPRILYRFSVATLAHAFAKGWLDVDRRYGERSLLWVAQVGAPATRPA
jgi:hypothetical protein